jgi:hypothetical protein
MTPALVVGVSCLFRYEQGSDAAAALLHAKEN